MNHFSTDPLYNPSLQKLPGIGRSRAQALSDAGIHDLLGLCTHLPCRYVDPAMVMASHQLPQMLPPQLAVVGRLLFAGESYAHQNQSRWFELHLGSDGQRHITARWHDYNIDNFKALLRLNDWLLLDGPIDADKHMQSPWVIPLGSRYPWPMNKLQTLSYPQLPGFGAAPLRKLVQQVVAHHAQRLDRLISNSELGALPSPSRALHQLHLDWPCEQIVALNQHKSPAHQTLTLLQQSVQLLTC